MLCSPSPQPQWRFRFAKAAGLALAALAFSTLPASAQSNRALGAVRLDVPGAPSQNLYAQSHALLIGASNYRSGWSRLPGVPDDIKALEPVLVKQGFSVTRVMDPTRDQLDAALRNFVAQHGQAEGNRLLVYFAGHGHTLTTSAGGRLGYIVPVDAPRPDQNLGGFKRFAYSMEDIEGLSKQIDARHALFVFDSCFSGTIFRTRAAVPATISSKTAQPVRQFITAGDENQPVPDQSIFRRQLVAALGEGEADLNRDGYITGTELGMFLEDKVTNYSRSTQTPRYGNIRDPNLDKGDFVFLSPLASVKPEPLPPGPNLAQIEAQAWEAARRANTAAAYNAYLREYPNGGYARGARVALASLEPAPVQQAQPRPVEPARPVQPAQAVQVSAGQSIKDCTDCPELVVVPAGTFQMGSNESDDEKPVHSVSVKSFAIGKYEVTQGQWKAVMGNNPSRFAECGDNCPVERVSWDDIQGFIQKLNQKTEQSYRLPTETEWEYACRGGQQQTYCGGEDINAVGWYNKNSGSKTHPVGQKAANGFGLYDMSGNVWEWVQDGWHSNYQGAPADGREWTAGTDTKNRVLRGGSWSNVAANSRAAIRYSSSPDNRSLNVGFRLARTVP